MIDSICRAQGYRTGLFTSPHLVTFRERIRVNGEMISEEAVANGLTTIRNLVANWDPHPTFFEVVTALALKHFSDTEGRDRYPGNRSWWPARCYERHSIRCFSDHANRFRSRKMAGQNNS